MKSKLRELWQSLCVRAVDLVKFQGKLIGEVSVAAATAVVGYYLARNETWRVSSKNRKLMGVAACGSTAAGDCSLDVFIDEYRVGRFYNLATGWPTADHIVACKGNFIPAGATLALVMAVAPTANPINVVVY